MARYRTIDIRIWMDAKFLSLDEGSQLLFIYLLTCPHVNQLGTVPMSEAVLAAYLNKPIETVAERLRNLSRMGLIRVDNGNLIWICNFLKYNPPSNPNCAKGLLAFFDEIPDCSLVEDVAESVVKACEIKGVEYVKAVLPTLQKYLDRKEKRNRCETVAKPLPNQEQEQEQEQEIVVAAVAEKPKTKREPHVPFPESLPDEWRQDAIKVRKDIVPERVFLKLRSRYAPTTTKKTIGMWHRIFIDWVGREFSDGKPNVPDHKKNNLRFDADYYADAKLPDGSIDWGI